MINKTNDILFYFFYSFPRPENFISTDGSTFTKFWNISHLFLILYQNYQKEGKEK